jgi:arylsulfatase A-like enzyme
MRRAIRKLLEEPETRARFAISARAFADHWLSEAAAARNAREVIEEWADGKPWAMEPDGWAAYVRARVPRSDRSRPPSLRVSGKPIS